MAEAAIRAEGLSKRFGDVQAVNELSLVVQTGEVFGFLGPNGAGKTTSINMICGLLRPDAGRVFIGEREARAGDAESRARIGVCPQGVVTWGTLTCIEQLEFIGEMYGLPRLAARARGDKLLAAMQLTEKRDKQARTLSGGMQRRLNLIMALVHDPEIVVLDEPEAGLDPQSRVLVREYIRAMARRKTVILTTHNMDEADRVCDRVAIIDHGRLLELDTPANLKRQAGEGDVLEISITGDAGAAAAALTGIAPGVSAADDLIVVRAHAVAELLPAVLARLQAAGCKTSDVRLREASLEDVFIALTGRGLRE